MPRLYFVKKARKDNPVAKKGESYYWWKPMIGGRGGPRRYSKERPKESRLTQSEFLSAVYSIQEDMEDFKPDDIEHLEDAIQTWISQIDEIRDECEDKFNNMPDGLQQGDTGQLLEERRDAMEEWSNELQNIDVEPNDEEKKDVESFLADKLREILDIGVNV